MKLACLFWFYKSPSLCENRLRLFQRYNPRVDVFGLYGGPPSEAHEFQATLGRYLKDFYAFREDRSERWKWRHGDRMLSRWFEDRGHALDWDTVFVLQWDMLVFSALEREFPALQKGELLMSGLRPVAEVSEWWSHLRPGSEGRTEYEEFLSFVRREHDFREDPMCGLFIAVCLPRQFLERYGRIPRPELGFLEYKIPVYAQIFGVPLHHSARHSPWWDDHPAASGQSAYRRALNAGKEEVPLRVIEAHRALPGGRRIFHPAFQPYPLSLAERCKQTARDFYRHEMKQRWWNLQRQLSRHD